MITVFSNDIDQVVNARYLTCVTDYAVALDRLYPLVDKLDIQRKLQTARFYERLKRDLIRGCIMPPLTLAFVEEQRDVEGDLAEQFVNENIGEAFVLDG